MPFQRTEGWEGRFAAAVSEVQGWGYQLGTHDCITLACYFVKALTGEDLWQRWAGKYDCLRGAMVHIVRAADFTEPYLTNAVTNVLGVEPSGIREARRGDIVEWRTEQEPHIGIALHAEAMGFGPQGVYFVPMKLCAHCWRVG